ncbi:MAG: hypothetical protein Q9195_004654 [Heterodermia aff. obscurata]
MLEKVAANKQWKYDYIDHYDLNEMIIGGYLREIWGNYKYFVERSGDDFRFWVPRKLKEVCEDHMAVDWGTIITILAQHEQAELLSRREPKKFVQAIGGTSRSKLQTTREMLMLCFTYFRVMPEFLDFLICFGYRSRPQDAYFSSFRQRTCLSASNQSLHVPELAWSGSEISMCYNLRSAERSGSGPNDWSIRLCAVHHTFDLKNVRSNWIIIKNNDVLKERVEHASSSHSSSEETSFDTLDRAFAAALNTHLVFCDLSVEQWRWYVNNLDEQFQESSGKTLTAYVGFPTSPTAATDEFSKQPRTDTGFSNGSILDKLSRTQTMLSEKFFIASPKPKVQKERIYTDPESGLSQPLPPHVVTGSDPESAAQIPRQDAEHGEQQDFSFAKLQKVQYIEEKAHEALLVMRSNIGIIRQLKKYYDTILKSKHFPQNVALQCQDDLEQFQLRINDILEDLQMQVIRVESLLQLLRDRKTLVNSITQSV